MAEEPSGRAAATLVSLRSFFARMDKRARRGLVAGLTAVAVLSAVLLVLDLWVGRSGPERVFLSRNLQCLRCHADLIPTMKMRKVHRPFLVKSCVSCHTPHATERIELGLSGGFKPWHWLRDALRRFALNLVWSVVSGPGGAWDSPGGARERRSKAVLTDTSRLVSEEGTLCRVCHRQDAERAMKLQHPPFERGKCTSCHDPHGSDHVAMMKGEAADVCQSCHRTGPELAMAVRHPPFVEGKCMSCHRPHASEEKRLLPTSERELCFGCHKGIASLEAKRVKHDPFAHGCVGCHRPHSAGLPRLLVAEAPALCYRCHGQVRDDFTMPSKHPVGDSLVCFDCHGPHATDAEGVLWEAQPKICFGCHGAVAKQADLRHKHPPFEGSKCTGSCHKPHGSADAPLLVAAQPGLCYGCHEEVRKDFGLRSAHPIGRRFSCSSCHFPHASPQPRLLLRQQRALCFGCHPNIQGLEKLPVQHKPFEGGDCTDRCHRPHGSGHSPLLAEAQPIICVECHAGKASGPNRHTLLPVPGEPGSGRCSMCHMPHAGLYQRRFIAEGRNLCFTCHDELKPNFVSSRHDKLDCTNCHRIHNAPGVPILRRHNPEVCARCHRQMFDFERNHPATPNLLDPRRGVGLTCSSTCHNPHGTGHDDMLRGMDDKVIVGALRRRGLSTADIRSLEDSSIPDAYELGLDGFCLQCHPVDELP